MIRAAAIAQHMRSYADLDEYAAVARSRVEAAGADVLVFPEYGSLELASLLSPAVRGDLQSCLRGLQALRDDFVAIYRELAESLSVTIVCPSIPWRVGDGFVNRAWVASPGELGFQDKVIMTRFERERWGITGGRELAVFDSGGTRFGVTICYDVEFPMIARQLVERGATLLAAPSCTDTLAGYNRVRIGARARALESQCVVAHAVTVGLVPDSPAVDVNIGAAGLFGPPDRGFPDDGVLAEGPLDSVERWVRADVDPVAIDAARRSGQVLVWRDFAEHLAWRPTP